MSICLINCMMITTPTQYFHYKKCKIETKLMRFEK